MRILISAGEASGELYGAKLIEALRQEGARRSPQLALEFFGVGGERMQQAGCELVVNAHEIAVVGLAEVVEHLPRIYQRFRRVVAEAERRRPDAAVLIDFPDFNFRLARELHKRGIPVIYYVSPQLWAWRQSRIELVRKYVRKMLVIFPFEEKFYRERGIEAEFVGHPLADLPLPSVTREEFAAEYGIDAQRPWIALLPGSRKGEVSRIFPKLLEAAQLLGPEYVYIVPVASTLDTHWMTSFLAQPHRSADYVYQRCPGHVASRSRGRSGQRNVNAGGGADRHAVRDGVPGGSAHLDLRPPSSKGGPVRHGELDCRARCGARAGAGRIHRRSESAPSCRRSCRRAARARP